MPSLITVPDADDLAECKSSLVKAARNLVVSSHEDAERANEFLRGVKALAKDIKERFEPAVVAANKAHKELTALRGSLLSPLEDAESHVKRLIGDWTLAERRKADEARRKAEEEARRLAEEEQMARAAALERQGRTMEAQAEIDAPVIVEPAIIAPPDMPKIAWTAVGEKWSARVDNLLALVRHVAANPSMIGLLKADQQALDALARASKRDFSLPGVSAVCEAKVSVR